MYSHIPISSRAFLTRFLSNLLTASVAILSLYIFQNFYAKLNTLILLTLGTLIILLIPIFQGINIPLAVKILDESDKKHSTGFVYFSNTIGSVFGSLFVPRFWCRLFCPVGLYLNEMVRLRRKIKGVFSRKAAGRA